MNTHNSNFKIGVHLLGLGPSLKCPYFLGMGDEGRNIAYHLVREPSGGMVVRSAREVFGHLPVLLYSFEVYSSKDSYNMISNSFEVSNFNWLVLKSTGSSVTNRRFFLDIGCA